MKYILVFFFSLFFFKANSQSLYEIKFRGQGDTTHYKAFLVYYNENDAYMRIGYRNRAGLYRVVEIRYKGNSGTYKNGKSYFSLTGSTPKFITSKSEEDAYNPDYFVWIGNETLPYTTDVVPDANSQRNVYRVDSYKKLEVKQLKKTYLRAFYAETEKDYLALLKMSSDGEISKPVITSTAATLHLVVLANTDIFDIGSGCGVDMRHLDNEFEGIATTLNINYHKYLIYGSSFTKSNLLNTIDGMAVGSNDIVLFFYRGHGFRWSNQTSAYPSLAITRSHSIPVNNENTLLLETVYNRINAKGGRLNITLADCCNSDIGINQQTKDNYLYMQSNASAEYAKLNELFMKRKGNLIAAASEKGEVSWTNSVYGGFFTTSFLQAVSEEISYMKTSESSWVNIVSNTRNYAISKSNNCSNCSKQHAISYNLITKK